MTDNKTSKYMVKPHPLNKDAYLIVKGELNGGSKVLPVGEYVVFDKEEDKALTVKKLEALQACLNNDDLDALLLDENGQRERDDGDHQDKEQQHISFQRVGAKHCDDVTEQIVFYKNHLHECGATTRDVNAVLTLARNETYMSETHMQERTDRLKG